MDNPYKSRYWRIRLRADWVLKEGVEGTLPCPACKGTNYQQYSFGMTEDDLYHDGSCQATDCIGGQVPNPEIEPKPRMPEVFLNHMRAMFNEFFDQMDARRERSNLK
jgi:hypothetical protein